MEPSAAAGVQFTAEGHASRLVGKMARLRIDGSLCDVVLVVGSREIGAHRLVLSACSNYFCAMFTNKMRESRLERVHLAELDGDALEDIVEFAYTAKINVHEGNVQSLLKAASILQLSEIVGACCNFLSGQMHPSNCLGIAAFAEAHGCTALEEAAMEYVRDNFNEVIHCEEFQQLIFEDVAVLLGSDYINITSEELAFKAMYSWLNYNVPEREKHAYELLKRIRLPLLSPVFLAERVFTKPILKKNPQCLELIMNAMTYHAVEEKRAHMREFVSDMPRRAALGILFVIGGMDTCRNKVTLEYYDARKDQWILVGNLQATCKRLQFGVAVVKSQIYIVGGRNGLRTLNSVDCYDPATNSWESIPPMCSYRHGVGVAELSGPMYAVGGHDGWSYLSSVERYDPEVKAWSYIAPMSSSRSTAGVAILEGKLYAVGGRDSNACLNTAERYDPHTNRWTALPLMNEQRGGVGVAVLFGKLYAIGGHDSSDPLHSVEVYDPKTNEWTYVSRMLCARDAVATVTFGAKIFAIGGFDGSMYLSSVECYDVERDEWKMASELRSGRAGAGAVTISNFYIQDLPTDVV